MNALFFVLMLANVSLAPLLHASQWIGQAPAANELSGKVVLVDVFTYSCINCKHVVPELQRLRDRYGRKDLEIVGIHTPELPYRPRPQQRRAKPEYPGHYVAGRNR